MFGAFAALIIAAIVVRFVNQFQPKDQQRTVTGVAVTAGIVISLGLSPFGTVAVELAQLSKLVPAAFPAWVSALVTVETGLGLLYGSGVMWEKGGLLAVGLFGFALIGGMLLPHSPVLGIIIVLFAWSLMELSPADQW
jgi:hypothetical protein